ncbi:MAG: hypothetical protein P9L92_08855 [Candidatus Electryonea clarkiae]|nr:hypothetical protein [Candidatus Electryonea clarkiae]MDP8286320.1 hypothetical protein [Candidatus Electryonea clarkiae]
MKIRRIRVYKALVAVLMMTFSLLFLQCCGNPNNPIISDSVEPYTVLSITPTYSFPNNVAISNGKLYLAQNFPEVLIYDFSNTGTLTLIDTLIDDVEDPVHFIGVAEDMNILFVNYKSNTRAYWLDELLFTNFEFGSSKVRDLLAVSRTDTVVSEYDNDYHSADVAMLLTADSDAEDAFAKDYIFYDSLEYNDSTRYDFRHVRQAVGLHYSGQAPLGLAFASGYDTLVVGLADFGVGVADMSNTLGQSDHGDWIGFADTPGEATHLKAEGGYAYVADGIAGLAIVDISDLLAPEYVTSWRIDGLDHAVDIAIHGNALALLDQFDGVYLLNISDPENPVHVGEYLVREPTSVTFSDEGFLVITSHGEGLTILELISPEFL